MKLKNLFTKSESKALILIFLILIVVAIPNFIASLRRARDQVRRDDLGSIVHALAEYYSTFEAFPLSSPDGKIMNCLKLGDVPYKDEKGQWIINPIPCEWAKDPFVNQISGRVYMKILPRDPNWESGASYKYVSDGRRYQLFATMEGKSEPEVDKLIIDQGLSCGTQVCNVGRSYACDIPKTLTICEEEAVAAQRQSD